MAMKVKPQPTPNFIEELKSILIDNAELVLLCLLLCTLCNWL
jgi:hypothetical protein